MDWLIADDYWIGRRIFDHLLAVIYVAAFLGAALQGRALIGERGLTPATTLLRRVPFRRSPSIFHARFSDRVLLTTAWTGVVISAALAVGLFGVIPAWAVMACWLVLWLLYVSIVNIGGVWYGFGWESLLCETGFYAIVLGSTDVAPSWLTLIALRWLLFRIEFGAGRIKIRGDSCWRDLTALNYHHETQPMPGPLSWWFHHLPAPLHKVEVAANHVTQLGIPFLLFLPHPVSTVAAIVMIVTQLWLVCSGNFAWLNWLTIAVATTAVPDSVWHGLLGLPIPEQHGQPVWFVGVTIAAALLVLALSRKPALNLIAERQLMNYSYNRLHLVNAYGAFGSITRVRHEVELEGTTDEHPDAETVWSAYGFRGKPGEPRRLPRQFAPYHLRLDWMMWFLALDPHRRPAWFLRLLRRLLEGDRATLRLMRHDPFGGNPPRYVRALVYRYRFTTWHELRTTRSWWHRDLVGEVIPPVTLDDVRRS